MIEYKVREVTRYIVTRFEDKSDGKVGSRRSSSCGEFDNEELAYEVAHALAFEERETLGWPPGDDRMQFPDRYKAEG